MAGNCQNPKNQVAVDRAIGQASGRDIFTEAERTKEFNGEQRFHYENMMAKEFGIDPKKRKGASVWDATAKTKPKKIAALDGQNYDRPSQIFSKKFYGAIDKKLTDFDKGKDTSIEAYRDKVAKDVRKLLNAINSEAASAKSKADLDKRLSKFGLSASTLYHGKEYLNWLEKGGHLQKSDHALLRWLEGAGSNVAKAQATLNGLWTLGNGVDMQRVYSHYLTRKPSSIANVVKGSLDAIAATKGQPWRRIPELEKLGIYGSENIDRGGKNITPFELSITAQKNLTYFLDKASGGNGTDGIRDLLFDSKPWDRPAWDRIKNTKLIFDLARYPINESRWLVKTIQSAAAGNKSEQVNLLTYSLGRIFFTGSASIFPAIAYAGLSKDFKDGWKAFEDKLPVNAIKKVSRAAFGALGIDAELDTSEYFQPGGGNLGSRLSTIKTTAQKTSGAVRAFEDLAKGNIPAALTRTAQAGSAVANLTGWGRSAKILGLLNSTQTTNMLDTLSQQLEGEFKTPERFKRELAKDIFGTAVKKAN